MSYLSTGRIEPFVFCPFSIHPPNVRHAFLTAPSGSPLPEPVCSHSWLEEPHLWTSAMPPPTTLPRILYTQEPAPAFLDLSSVDLSSVDLSSVDLSSLGRSKRTKAQR